MMRPRAHIHKAIGALNSALFALLLSAQISIAQSLLPIEEAAIAGIISRISNGDDIRDDLRALGTHYVAMGRLAAAETLFKKVITEVDTPENYLRDYQPPIWASPGRMSIAIASATFIAFPGLISLLVQQDRKEEALEYADMMRAKMLRALIERNAMGQRPFATFSTMSASHMRTLAKETQSTFIVYLLLPMLLESSAKEIIKPRFHLLAWVIQPTGSIALEILPVEETRVARNLNDVAGEMDDSDPISFTTNSFSRSLKRGVIDRLEAPTRTQQRRGFEPEGANALRRLHELLISRLEAYLPTNPDDKVVIVPDGSLYLVPFAVLPDSGGKSLIERHTLSIVPSLGIYEILRRSAKQRVVWNSVKSILVVGNPKMPAPPEGSGLEGKIPALQGADQEADAVAALFRTKALKGRYALEDEVIARMPGSELIHFATHGLLIYSDFVTTGNFSGSLAQDLPPGVIVLADNPKKKIKIAEGDYSKTPINGFLSSGKILRLRLNADLVTLSACDTARGRMIEHDFAALPSALMAVGARSVLMTLWSIPDAPTAEMMPVFYKELLAGRSKAAALRYAMLWTKERHHDVGSWGAFTLIGLPE